MPSVCCELILTLTLAILLLGNMFFSPNNSLFVIEPLPYIEILKYTEFWSCFKPPEKLATFPCQAIATWSVSDNSVVSAPWLLAAVLQDLVLDKEASQTSQVEREFNEFIFAKFCCSSSARLCREK